MPFSIRTHWQLVGFLFFVIHTWKKTWNNNDLIKKRNDGAILPNGFFTICSVLLFSPPPPPRSLFALDCFKLLMNFFTHMALFLSSLNFPSMCRSRDEGRGGGGKEHSYCPND